MHSHSALESKMMSMLHRFQRFNMSAIFNDVTRGEFLLLEILLQKQQCGGRGAFVSELADRLTVSNPAVSRMLRSMEQRGWVERRIDAADRRNTLVCITDVGRQVIVDTEQHLHSFSSSLSSRMGQQDMQTLVELLGKLLDIMDDELQRNTKKA